MTGIITIENKSKAKKMVIKRAFNPLLPYRVLDLTDEKGFLCGKILGDLGADVIKIEKPGGDPSRNIGPFYHDIPDSEKSLYWFAYNSNKRSITLNIETDDGKEIFKNLVKTADFVLESFDPGYLDKIGLGYCVLKEVNPNIIMVAITPFGQTGVRKNYIASDLVCLALGGLLYLCGSEDGPPMRVSGSGQAYLQAGIQAAVSALMANCGREKNGGTYIDFSIQEAVCWATECEVPYWAANKEFYKRRGIYHKRGGRKHRRIFECKDGYVTCQILTGKMAGPMHARLVQVMDSEGLAGGMKDIDWSKLSLTDISEEKMAQWEELLIQFFKKHTKFEIQEMAVKHQLVACPVNNIEDITKYPQLEARNVWTQVEHSELGDRITYPGFWGVTDKGIWGMRFRVPLIGEHNLEVYEGDLGLQKEKLIYLKQAGVI